MASTSSSAPATRPSLQLVPPPTPLYRDPKNRDHFAVLPFRVNQKPAARCLTPADRFAADAMQQYLKNYRGSDGMFHLEPEVLQSLLAYGFNKGVGTGLDIEYAEAATEA